MKVLISTSSFGKFDSKPLEILKDQGYEVALNPYGRKLTPDEVVELGQDCVGIIAGTEPLGEEVFKKLELRAISRCGTGMDNVNLEAAKSYEIKVMNTPGILNQAVAEIALGFIIDLLRKISLMDRNIRAGVWKKEMGNLVKGKIIGIIGVGNIGRRVAEIVSCVGAEVIAYDKFEPPQEWLETYGVRMVDISELLKRSDVISLHMSYSDENYHFIGNKEFEMMKEGACIINLARGDLVDEEALYSHLKGKLAGAALDTFEEEPYNGKLKDLDNVILTPHVGSYAVESRIEMEMKSVENLIEMLGGVDN